MWQSQPKPALHHVISQSKLTFPNKFNQMANLLAEDTEMIFEVQFFNFFCSLIEMETVHTGNQILRLSGRSVYTT